MYIYLEERRKNCYNFHEFTKALGGDSYVKITMFICKELKKSIKGKYRFK